MEPRLMIKQRLGEIPANATDPLMEVFISTLPGWYIFAVIVMTSLSLSLLYLRRRALTQPLVSSVVNEMAI